LQSLNGVRIVPGMIQYEQIIVGPHGQIVTRQTSGSPFTEPIAGGEWIDGEGLRVDVVRIEPSGERWEGELHVYTRTVYTKEKPWTLVSTRGAAEDAIYRVRARMTHEDVDLDLDEFTTLIDRGLDGEAWLVRHIQERRAHHEPLFRSQLPTVES
jgi:hypothetical protein